MNRRMRIKSLFPYVFFLIFLIFCVVLPAGSQTESRLRNAVLFIAIDTGADSDDQYIEVIENAAKLAFAPAKLIIKTTAVQDLPEVDENYRPHESEILPEAVFLLQGSYTVQGSFISVQFVWSDLREPDLQENFTERFYIDLSLDEEISKMVKEILNVKMAILERIAFLPEKKEEEIIVEQKTDPEKKPGKKKFQIQAGVSGFLTTGRASDYFGYGFMPNTGFSLLVYPGFGELALGIGTGAVLFQVSDITPDYQSLIPLGIDVSFRFPVMERLYISTGFSSGPAFMLLNIYGDFQAKTIIFTSFKASAAWLFTPEIGIELTAGYMIFFESEEPITGFLGGLSVFYRI